MKTLPDVESHWQRLPWTLPTALLILAVALWGLASFMEKQGPKQPVAPPIDAQFVELPAPARFTDDPAGAACPRA